MKSLMTAALFLCLGVSVVYAEDVKISTYYPSPYGSYKQLTVGQVVQDTLTMKAGYIELDNTSTITGNLVQGLLRLDPNDDVMRLGTWTSNPLAFNTTTHEQMRITATGNVGIGTTAPSDKLTVYSTSTGGGMGVDGNSSPGYHLYNSGSLKAMIGLATTDGAWSTDSAANDMVIRTQSATQKILFNDNAGLGASAMSINSGKVGIGTASPGFAMEIVGDSGADWTKAAMKITNTGVGARGYSLSTRTDGTFNIGDETAGRIRFQIDGTGNTIVTSGNAGQQGNLVIYGNGNPGTDSYSVLNLEDGTFNVGAPIFDWALAQKNGHVSAAYDHNFNMTYWDGSGNIHIFETMDTNGHMGLSMQPSAAYLLGVNGSVGVWGNIQSTGNISSGGTIYDTDGIVHVSDQNLKHDIIPINGALDKIALLEGVTFKWNDADKHPHHPGRQVGLIAQNVEKAIPSAVILNPEGYKTVDDSQVIGLTVQAVNELKKENDSLKAKNEELERRVKTLEDKLGVNGA